MDDKVSVCQYLERIIKENDRRYEERFQAQEKAVTVGITALEDRLRGMNEFRGTLEDQARKFIPRSEAELALDTLHGEIDKINSELSTARAERMGIKGGWGYAVAVMGVVISLASIIYALSK
jgi:hypothetical protein